MIIRLTQKLADKIDAGKLPELPLEENPFADWSCHLFTADRTQYIIICNTVSLYSCVMYGKGITNESYFIERGLSTIREFMEDDGQSFGYQTLVAPASECVTFAKSLNRSVTASMSELIRFAKDYLVEEDLSPHSVGFQLNDTLLSSIAESKSDDYSKPREAFLRLLDKCSHENS